MKALLFFVLLVLTVQGYSQSVTIPALNSGLSSGSNSLQRKPLGSYYGYERSAFIYSPYELGVTDTIGTQSIAFFVDSVNSGIATSTPIKVYLKDISDTTFTSATTTASELNGATLVYNNTLPASAFIDSSWVILSLSNYFVHYPGNALEVIIETNAGSNGNEGVLSKGFRRNTAGLKRFQYWQQDNTPPAGAGTLDTLRPNIRINYFHIAPCNGTLTPGTILLTDTAVCAGTATELILQGSSQGAQLSIQWQQSTDGINFSDIAGATQPNYFATINSTIFFRTIVSCGSNSDTTAVAQVNTLLPTYCYCTATLGGGCTTGTNGISIDSLSIVGTGFNASLNGCENNMAPHYSAYAPTGNYTATLAAGQTYTLTVRHTGNNITSMWIDYNHDGVFGTNEWTQVNTSSFTGGVINKAFTINSATALNGLTGMRVRSRASGIINDSTSACTGFTSGETEDFMVTITGGGTIGIGDHLSVMDVRIFPNPNKGSFAVETGSRNTAFLVEVSDILGHVIFSKMEESGDGKIALDLEATPGVYFVRGINILNRSAFVQKVIIE